MSEESFLTRWSRRKREAGAEPDAPAKANETTANQVVARDQSHTLARDDQSATAQPPAPAPAFDPASLPALDSITATTDVRPFLQPGVPPALTREALRRIWSADSAIRDFVGLQEYDWDYNTPGAIAGFGELGSEHNIKEMLARVLGEHPSGEDHADTAPQGQPIAQVEELASAGGPERGPPDSEPSRVVEAVDPQAGPDDFNAAVRLSRSAEELVRRNSEVAMQQDDPDSQNTHINRRSHGGALPQ
jgi:hypothetical protein